MARGTRREARTQGASICVHIGATEDAASRRVTYASRPEPVSGQTPGGMAYENAVSTPLRQLPNALTILRFAAIPLFIVLLVRDQDGPSWLAAITDQLDGWLARRWRVESAFGKVADPLADRLMIDVAVVLLVVYDRLPWVALIILVRYVLLGGGYRL